jgi:hypothetical protein
MNRMNCNEKRDGEVSRTRTYGVASSKPVTVTVSNVSVSRRTINLTVPELTAENVRNPDIA